MDSLAESCSYWLRHIQPCRQEHAHMHQMSAWQLLNVLRYGCPVAILALCNFMSWGELEYSRKAIIQFERDSLKAESKFKVGIA